MRSWQYWPRPILGTWVANFSHQSDWRPHCHWFVWWGWNVHTLYFNFQILPRLNLRRGAGGIRLNYILVGRYITSSNMIHPRSIETLFGAKDSSWGPLLYDIISFSHHKKYFCTIFRRDTTTNIVLSMMMKAIGWDFKTQTSQPASDLSS